MLIKQILGAVVASTALIGGVAIGGDAPPEQQVAPAPAAATEQVAPAPATATETAAEQPDDAILATNVKTALTQSAETQAFQIAVESQAGIVRLSGAVDNAKAKEAASTVALSVNGVKDVQNELTVTGT